MRAATRDRSDAPDGGGAQVYTTKDLGPNRSLLANGSLLCRNVPIARTGTLLYGPKEVPVAPGPRGIAYVERTADTLFAPSTIASFQTAAVTDDHPPVDVTPDNWERLACGYAINVRRGTGDQADLMLADLVITRRSTIDKILAGKVEVSPGYEADYRDLGGGIGRQYNILGNHIALVGRGRCGPRCAIGDAAYIAEDGDLVAEFQQASTHLESYPMAADDKGGAALTRRPTNVEAARRRFLDAQADLEAAESGQSDREVHVHVHTGPADDGDGARAPTADAARIEALETDVTEIKGSIAEILEAVKGKPAAAAAATTDAATVGEQPGEGEGDSKALETGYKALASQAEILVPGFKVPTFDAAMSRAKTVDRMCNVRRQALTQFAAQGAVNGAMLSGINGGQAPDLLSMDCPAVASLFATAAVAKAALNNAAATTHDGATAAAAAPARLPGAMKVLSAAEINKQNQEFWAKQP